MKMFEKRVGGRRATKDSVAKARKSLDKWFESGKGERTDGRRGRWVSGGKGGGGRAKLVRGVRGLFMWCHICDIDSVFFFLEVGKFRPCNFFRSAREKCQWLHSA